MKFDVSSDEFAQQIKLSELASYVLCEGDEVLAFGQFYVRLGRHHFGRLAVSPKHRGKRLAYQLLSLLAQQATNVQTANGYSLFVLSDNKPAIQTYQNCGFEFAAYPQEKPGGLTDCLYMTAETLHIPTR
ncbi:GNAT family N-acetyltransferase [Planctobacterium marinum]|uniref:GNAT family N-acetyltransferase n=1 Tax=Planctobacterium marinum TaxID=1631968 RepID=UPI0030C77F53